MFSTQYHRSGRLTTPGWSPEPVVSGLRTILTLATIALLLAVPSSLPADDFPSDALPLKRTDSEQKKKEELPSLQPDADATKDSEDKTGDADSEKPAPGPKQAEEALFRKLTGGDDDGESIEDPIEQLNTAIEKMRKAREHLDKQDAGESTTGLQEDVVQDLEKLVEFVRKHGQQQMKRPGSRQQNTQPQQRPRQQPDESQANSGEKPPFSESAESGQQPGQAKNDQGEGSDESIREAEKREAAALQARRETMVDEAWGHLPPRLRERILNINSDKYLSRYAPEIRRYFEALAKQPAE